MSTRDLSPNVLEVPTLTFLSWHKRQESYAFPLNTRPRDRDTGHEPSPYYMHHVNNIKKVGSTRISYSRGDRLQRKEFSRRNFFRCPLSKKFLWKVTQWDTSGFRTHGGNAVGSRR